MTPTAPPEGRSFAGTLPVSILISAPPSVTGANSSKVLRLTLPMAPPSEKTARSGRDLNKTGTVAEPVEKRRTPSSQERTPRVRFSHASFKRSAQLPAYSPAKKSRLDLAERPSGPSGVRRQETYGADMPMTSQNGPQRLPISCFSRVNSGRSA